MHYWRLVRRVEEPTPETFRRLQRRFGVWWNCSEKPWLRKQWERLFLPLREPSKFRDIGAIKRDLSTDSESLSAELLEEAREIFAAPVGRAEGVERRATTLLGTVGIAASFSVAGAGLLLDGQKVHGTTWRLLVAVGFLLTTSCFAMCGWRALQALSRLQKWSMPKDVDILGRKRMGLADARIDLAASLLKSAGANEPVAEWKVAHLGAATWWLLRALFVLIATALVLVLYVAFGPTPAIDNLPTSSTPGHELTPRP
jgi:hypothetical protein